MSSPQDKSPRKVFYGTVHLPRVGVVLAAVVLLLNLFVLTMDLSGGLRVTVLTLGVTAIGYLAYRLERGLSWPRLVIDSQEIRYRDRSQSIRIDREDIRSVSGGRRLQLTLKDGVTVDLPAIGATQAQVAFGTESYPDKVAAAIDRWMHSTEGDQAVVTEARNSPAERRAKLIAMIIMGITWLLVVLLALHRG